MIRSGVPLMTLICVLVLSTSSGCSSSDADQATPKLHREVQDASTGTKLRVQTDHDTIGIADRMWIEAEWTWTGTTPVSLMPPEWKEHDWTLLETVHSPTTRTDEGYSAATSWLVEPFLPGEYTIPSPMLLVEHETTQRELSVEPLAIHVEGVLPDGDRGELNPIAPPASPTPSEQRAAPIWVGVIATLSLLALLVLWRSRRGKEQQAPESIYTQLEKISRNEQADRQRAYAQLDRVLARLDPRLRQTSEVTELIRECQRARFAKHYEPRITPARIAQHALELFGHERDHSKPGATP